MKTYQVLCASMLLACAAGANADINKCVDSEGRVTFTDTPCGDQNAAPATSAAPQAQAMAQDGVTLAAGEPQLSSSGERIQGAGLSIAARDVRSPWASLPRAVQKRAISLDAATLQAARSTMVMQDSLRRQVASR